MSENPSTVKFMMIQAGLVPENVVQQLVRWRLLPKDSAELTGSRPVSLEREWSDVESFVNELRSALDEEAKTIRETNLDNTGGYRPVSLRLRSQEESWRAENVDVFVDQFGRVILPAKERYADVLSITFLDEQNGSKSAPRNVVQIERRYRDNKVTAFVVYVEE